jgi:hypothetical protein
MFQSVKRQFRSARVPCAFTSLAAIPAADMAAGFVEIEPFVEGTAVDISGMIVIPSMYD